MSTSCGVPSSWLSNVIVNRTSAGAWTVFWSNATLCATRVIPGSPGGPPEPGGAPDGAGEPPGSPPAVSLGGSQPWSSTIATTSVIAIAQSTVLGQAGAGRF